MRLNWTARWAATKCAVMSSWNRLQVTLRQVAGLRQQNAKYC